MSTNSKREEKRIHSTLLIPYSYYDCRIPEKFANVLMHWHTEFELNYVTDGLGEFYCGDKKFLAKKGDILFLPPNMLHAAFPFDSSHLAYDTLVFSPSLLGVGNNDRATSECIQPFIRGTLEMEVHIDETLENYSEFVPVVEHIFQYAKSNTAQTDLLLKSSLLYFFWLYENNKGIDFSINPKFSLSEMLRPTLHYISSHYRQPLSIDLLAKEVHLSNSYFMGCFKKAVGVSALEYITQLRIRAICEELLQSEEEISTLAYQNGFSNLSNFNRQFKKIVGCTPKQYRSNYSK